MASTDHEGSSGALTDLERLAALRASDAISIEEFNEAKGRVLARV
jgi:hypothetical protein